MKDAPARVLIVEDETIVARDIASQLETFGHIALATAQTGEEGIRLASELAPDLILMDISLAGEMDGLCAAQHIRKEFGLPIVFITAYEADDVLQRAKLSEPYGYILKPFSDRELRSVVEMAIYKAQSEQRQLECAMRYRVILENISDCVISVDDNLTIESFNRAAETMFGCVAGDMCGVAVNTLFPKPQSLRFVEFLRNTFQFVAIPPHQDACCTLNPAEHSDASVGIRFLDRAGQHDVLNNVNVVRRDGQVFPADITVSKMVWRGRTTFVLVVRDITQKLKNEEAISRLAFYDPLTELPNRRLLLDRLDHAVSLATREKKYAAILFLDLDHFKQLNDLLGHHVGDDFLRQVASRLRSCVRQCDTVSRMGGDEFVLLLEGLSDSLASAVSQTKVIAEKVLSELCKPFHMKGIEFNTSASIGVVLFVDDHVEQEEMLRRADSAMYAAKAAGRNRFRFYTAAMSVHSLQRSRLETSLQSALANNEFYLDYQIQVDEHDQPIGVEALLRWRSEAHGIIAPSQFIPLAEAKGEIYDIGRWVLQEACKQLAVWKAHPEKSHWVISVNLSLNQISQAGFVDSVRDAVLTNQIDPTKLKLEIKEGIIARDIEDVISKMESLSKLGISFSLDDFGAGYSSICSLRRLPIDTIKIDQAIVKGVLTNNNDAVVAKSIIALAHSMGIGVLAEGVETDDQRLFFRQYGCDAYQGYLIGKPVSADILASYPVIDRKRAH